MWAIKDFTSLNGSSLKFEVTVKPIHNGSIASHENGSCDYSIENDITRRIITILHPDWNEGIRLEEAEVEMFLCHINRQISEWKSK